MILLRTCLSLLLTVRIAFGGTIVVDDTGAGDSTTIQGAIDIAVPGDFVHVRPSSSSLGYQEAIVVNVADITISGQAICGFFCKIRNFFKSILNILTFGLVDLRSSSSARRFLQSKSLVGQSSELSVQSDVDRLLPSAVEKNKALHKEMEDLALLCSETVLDGGSGSTNTQNDIITVQASGVIIQNIRFRHGRIVFDTGSDRSTVQNSCFFASSSDPMTTVNGVRDSLTITSNTFFNGNFRSIGVDCDNCMVGFNTLIPCDNGIGLNGDGSTIHANVLKACNDESLNLSGDNLIVTDNLIEGGEHGIEIDGDNPTITGNTIIGCGDESIEFECVTGCTGGLIAHNHIEGSTDDDQGIAVSGNANNIVIEDNTIMFSTDAGIDYTGDNGIIRRNTVIYSGSESPTINPGFAIAGSNNLITDNFAQFVTIGFKNDGSGTNNVYRTNTVNVASIGGIILTSGDNHVVEDNTIMDVQADALGITSGTGHVVQNNVLIDNKVDLCNEVGALADISGQTVSTSSATCIHF